MTYSNEAITALALLRTFAGPEGGRTLQGQVVQAVRALDNAGVFAALDEQTDYASAEDILAESAAISMASRSNPGIPADRALAAMHNTWHPERAELDPAEWGDTTRADMARHQGYAAASRLGSLERVPGTDTLRPVLPEPEAVADEWAARARAIEGLIPKGSGAPVCTCGSPTDDECIC